MNSILIKDQNGKVVHTLTSCGDEALFGRDPKRCKVLFAPNAKGVSRIHGTLKWKDDKIVEFTDSSSHGTFINGKKNVGSSQILEVGENKLRVGESDYCVVLEEKQSDVEVISETMKASSFFTSKSRKRKSDASIVLDLESQVNRGPIRKKAATPKILEEPDIIIEEVSPIPVKPKESNRKFQTNLETLEEDENRTEKVSPIPSSSRNVKPSRKRELPKSSETPIRAKRGTSPMISNDNSTGAKAKDTDKSVFNPSSSSKLPDNFAKKEEISPPTCSRKKASNLTFFTNLIYENHQKPQNITTTTNESTLTRVNFKRFKPKNASNSTNSNVNQTSTVRIKLVDYRKLKT